MSGKVTKQGIVQLIPLDKIIESPYQVRIDYGDINGLSASIKKHDLIAPIMVRPSGEFFEVIGGNRRVRATRKAGLKFIRAIVKEVSDEEALILHGEENINRHDYSPIEEALYYKKCDELGKTLKQIAKDHKKSLNYLKEHLYLLELPQDIQKRVHNEEISFSKARKLTTLTRKKRTPQKRVTTGHQGFEKAPRTTEHYDDIRAIADDKELRDAEAVAMAAKLVRDGVPLPKAKDRAKKDYAKRMYKDKPKPLSPEEAVKALEKSLPSKNEYDKLGRSQVIQLIKRLVEDGKLKCPSCGKCGITWECSGQLIWEPLRSDEDV